MKKLTTILITIILLLTISSTLFISGATSVNPENALIAPTGDNKVDVGGIQELGSNVVTIISTIASIASIVILIVLGIKYMMGSAEEKAEYKKTLIPYIIGAIFVFAAASLAGVIYNFAQNI